MDGPVASILSAFRDAYVRAAPFRQDRNSAEELGLEAAPAVEALTFALSHASRQDVNVPEYREALALFSLLGRRAGTLGVTPTSALSIVPSIASALDALGTRVSPGVVDALQIVLLEGFVAAREERIVADAAARARESVPIYRIAPRCVVMILAGEHDADSLREIVEELGRRMFAADASSCLVDLTWLSGATPEGSAEVFAADATARMLGASCVFTGVDEAWQRAARDGRVSLDLVRIEPGFEEGLRIVLDLAGYELRAQRPPLTRSILELWRRRKK